MNLELKDRKVLIAGSSKGTGLAIARAFHLEGAKIWISGRDEKNLSAAREQLTGAEATTCDLESSDGRSKLKSAVESRWKSLDVLVLNVGSGKTDQQGLNAPDAEWQRVWNLNFLSHAALVREFAPLLKTSPLAATQNASIVAISSIAAHFRFPQSAAYGAAKAALEHFCMTSSAVLAADGIRFNIVCPGNIESPRWDELRAQNPAMVSDYVKTSIPLKRFASTQEIADVVAFAASPRAGFMTGSVLRVDGGQTLSI